MSSQLFVASRTRLRKLLLCFIPLRSHFIRLHAVMFSVVTAMSCMVASSATVSSVYTWTWTAAAGGIPGREHPQSSSLDLSIGVSTTGYYTDPVYFVCNNSSISTDKLQCDWSFGDGASASNIQFPSHQYANPGTYTVTATICDISTNFCGPLSQTFVLITRPTGGSGSGGCVPTMNLGGPYSGLTGELVPFLAADSGCTGVSFKWDYGDGVVADNGGQGNKGRWAPHVYTRPGTYTVTMSVKVCSDSLFCLTSSTSSATTTATIRPGPNVSVGVGVGVTFHDGVPDSFEIGSDGNLWRTFLSGSAWAHQNLGTPSPGVGIASGVGVTFHNGYLDVFLIGSDGNLWRMYSNGSPWVAQNLGTPSPGVSIASGVDVAFHDGYLDVFLIGSDGNLWRIYSNGSPWVNQNLGTPSSGVRIASGVGVAFHYGYLDVFLIGSDGNLWRTYSNGSPWVNQNLGTPGPGVSIASRVGVTFHNGYLDVFLIGSDGNLWRTYSNGSPWVTQNLGTPSSSVGISGGVGVTYDGFYLEVFFKSNDRNLWRTYANGLPWIYENLGTL